MDGENNGKPYEQMDDLGGSPIFGNTRFQSLERKEYTKKYLKASV